MPVFKVKVTQVSRVEREIVMEVEADTIEEAVENVESGAIDVPGYGEGWRETHASIQNEEVVPL